MKANLFDSSGKSKGSVELPSIFSTPVREDLVQKYFEVFVHENRVWYSPYDEAGRQHSASGTISHRRHEWKGHYGKGIARVPRKAMWRRGTQFYWIGAEVSGTRGGRSVHAPSGIRAPKKINQKEALQALNIGIAATASPDYVVKRYSSIDKISAPYVVESLPAKSKDLISSLKTIFGNAFPIVLQKKVVRAGIGKSRGRKYKSNAGLLIVKGKNEKVKCSGLEIRSVGEISVPDVFPLGRLTLYTKQAIEELGGKK